jgi:hypothetical protein
VDRPRLAVHVVHQEVLAQRIGRSEVSLAAAQFRHLLDEVDQPVIAGQDEGVAQDALALAAAHPFERAATGAQT